MAEHNEKGSSGEELAVAYLKGKSYKIRETNWRHYHKEIDIVAEHENKIVIVEVKCRSERNAESPSELLSRSKMKNMVEAAEAYIFRQNLMMEVRFDFILVLFGPYGHKIEHIPGAFVPGVNW